MRPSTFPTIALQLWMKYLRDVCLRCKANHDVQLLQFDIDWVIVLYEENLHLVFQDLRPKRRRGEKKCFWQSVIKHTVT